MDDHVRDHVRRTLERIEESEAVRVVYACESGSRAWGFESSDSDYDVRFLYVRPRDWYLSIDLERKRDVVELPVDPVWDFSGWDIRKALQLLHNSNPALLEWLGSPLVYSDDVRFSSVLQELAVKCHSPKSLTQHYFRMAERNWQACVRGDTVTAKKYLYVVRPLLATRWVLEGRGLPPVRFETVLANMEIDPALRLALEELIRRKRTQAEKDAESRIPAIDDFCQKETAHLSELVREVPHESRCDADQFSREFRALLGVFDGDES
ncbi:MAG: nucleotidyltransferase domain-containing protein [Candidatus Eisenbacteria bacterium]|uniref:Nucleotidyltransferase domain-containing protein n=1 Tax=Eiseniibacteriota bacterium TaxID=2212470 RepID=A0A956NF99_UNCEI|nr:nucleotidyltransferase domain-containing protein [Candidatus Eisenbacteria bacterium]